MNWISYVVKPEQFRLETVLASCGYWDFEISTDLLDLVWNDKKNSRAFTATRSKYAVHEGDYLWIPTKPVVPTPVVPGGAKNVLKSSPPPVTIWAASESGPLECKDEDVRLEFDQPCGQAGWTIATRFANFVDLGTKLGGGLRLPAWTCGNLYRGCDIQENQIAKLGICAHGAAGAIQINGGALKDPDNGAPIWQDPVVLSKLTIAQYKTQLQQILWALAPGATVIFFCCLSAESLEGVDLFKAISLEWQSKAITVVGFRSILYSNGAQQKKGGNHYVGARETHYASHRQGSGPAFRRVYDMEKYWNDLTLLAWANERSYHALAARHGQIIQRGAPPNSQGMGPGVDINDFNIYQGR